MPHLLILRPTAPAQGEAEEQGEVLVLLEEGGGSGDGTGQPGEPKLTRTRTLVLPPKHPVLTRYAWCRVHVSWSFVMHACILCRACAYHVQYVCAYHMQLPVHV